jgi:hypothetical protein
MSVLIPSEEGFSCEDCDFKTEDIFMFLEHCDICFSWNLRLSNRYSIDLYSILEEVNETLAQGEFSAAIEIVQSVALALVNSSEGEKTFHKFLSEAMTVSSTVDMLQGIEEMLKQDGNDEKHT